MDELIARAPDAEALAAVVESRWRASTYRGRLLIVMVAVVLLLLPAAAAAAVSTLSKPDFTANVDLVVKIDPSSANATTEVASTLDLLTTRALLQPIALRRHETVAQTQSRVGVSQVGDGGLAQLSVTGSSASVAMNDAQTLITEFKSTVASLNSSSSQEAALKSEISTLQGQQTSTQSKLLQLAPSTSARDREAYRQLVVQSEQLAQRLTDLQESLSQVTTQQLQSVGAVQQLSSTYLSDPDGVSRLFRSLAVGLVIGFAVIGVYLWLVFRRPVNRASASNDAQIA